MADQKYKNIEEFYEKSVWSFKWSKKESNYDIFSIIIENKYKDKSFQGKTFTECEFKILKWGNDNPCQN